MIKIRYRGSNELSPGLHATAERRGRRTTVYLLDGMTVAERRSALRRLRLTARMGHCPRLPAGQLAFALLTDRIRTGFGRTGRVLRLHPAGSTVPIMVLSGGAIAFLLFSTVSIHVLRPPRTGQSALGASPVVSASAIAIGTGSQNQAGPGGNRDPGDPGGSADPGRAGQGSAGWQLTQLTQLAQPTQPSPAAPVTSPVVAAGVPSGGSGAGTDGGSGGNAGNGGGQASIGGTSGGTTLGGGANPPQADFPHTTPVVLVSAPAATDTPSPSPTPSESSSSSPSASSSPPASSSSSGGVCVDVGPFGICLDV